MLGPQRVANSQESVERHGDEGVDAGGHAGKLDAVNQLADDVAERPAVRRVGDGMEWNTEDEEGEVGDGQVDDEDVGRAGVLLAVADDDNDDEDVSHAAEQDDGAEDERDDDALVAVAVATVLRVVPTSIVTVRRIAHHILD